MANKYVYQRLVGIQEILNGVHKSSAALSASSRGAERAAFIDDFLSNVLPPIFRFGTGDVTDVAGSRSGQLDVVVEYPVSPSLPSVGSAESRLYLAESVAAVIEVKSNVSTQWSEAVRTAQQLSPLRRSFKSTLTFGHAPTARIPLFVVGYTGWATLETLTSHLNADAEVAGILVIDAGLFATNKNYYDISATGPWALWALIYIIHAIANGLQAASTDPLQYALD